MAVTDSAIAAITSRGMGAVAARLVPLRRTWPLLLTAFLVTAVTIIVVTGPTALTIPTIGLTAVVWVAIGAFGGVLVNLAFRQSFLTLKNGDGAYVTFIAFYALCFAVTWAVFISPRAGKLNLV